MKPINLPVVPYSVLITFEGRCYIAKSINDWKQRYGYNEKDGSIKASIKACEKDGTIRET
jgi:hypothetical protein